MNNKPIDYNLVRGIREELGLILNARVHIIDTVEALVDGVITLSEASSEIGRAYQRANLALDRIWLFLVERGKIKSPLSARLTRPLILTVMSLAGRERGDVALLHCWAQYQAERIAEGLSDFAPGTFSGARNPIRRVRLYLAPLESIRVRLINILEALFDQTLLPHEALLEIDRLDSECSRSIDRLYFYLVRPKPGDSCLVEILESSPPSLLKPLRLLVEVVNDLFRLQRFLVSGLIEESRERTRRVGELVGAIPLNKLLGFEPELQMK